MNRAALAAISMLYVACGLWAIDWGLYSDLRERYLFPPGSEWSPHRVASELQSAPPAERGADVDPNPAAAGDTPRILNDSAAAIAELYSRFLLYSSQPDEMITFRALGRMDPTAGDFDPRLYQYGGVFVYPIGGLIKLADLSGWIRTGPLSEMLTRPREFARCYLVARGYVVLWGLIGVWLMYALGCRLGDPRSGCLAALLYALMPVVISLSHEAKPHLPGAVLMLGAVLLALGYLEAASVRRRLALAAVCGLAGGMVLSSVWIVVLIPLVECLAPCGSGRRSGRIAAGLALAALVYAVTNPYVLINAATRPAILESNLANSTAMYPLGEWSAGLANASRLLVAGSSIYVVIGGAVLLVTLWGQNWRRCCVLTLPAAAVFLQFAALAAGKPGEYGRFAVFPAAILALLLSAGLFRFLAPRWYQGMILSLAAATPLAAHATTYLSQLHLESTEHNSRYRLAKLLGDPTTEPGAVGVLRDPAPYGFPPLDFGRRSVVLIRPADIDQWPAERSDWPRRLIVPVNGVEGVDVDRVLEDGYYQVDPAGASSVPPDAAPVTWANKPLVLLTHRPAEPPDAP